MTMAKSHRIVATSVAVIVMLLSAGAFVDFAFRKKNYENTTETYKGPVQYENVDHLHSSDVIKDEHNPFTHLNDIYFFTDCQILPSKDGGDKLTDSDIRSYTRLLDIGNLSLTGTLVTDEGLKYLYQIPELKILDLSHTQVTDEGMTAVAGLAHLESLNIQYTRVTRKGLKTLKNAKQLAWLAVSYTALADGGLKALSELSQLEGLIVDGRHLTDQNISLITKLKKLKALHISEYNQLSDVGVAELCKLNTLQHLLLSRGNYGNPALHEIATLTHLQTLIIEAGPGVTDQGIFYLRPVMQNLTSLHVRGANLTEVTSNDLPMFRKEVPEDIVPESVRP